MRNDPASTRAQTGAPKAFALVGAIALTLATIPISITPAFASPRDDRGAGNATPAPDLACGTTVRSNGRDDVTCLERDAGPSSGGGGRKTTRSQPSIGPKLAPRDLTETTKHGAAVLTPLRYGETEALVRGHQFGSVAVTTKRGDVLWERHGLSLRGDWNLPINQRYTTPWMLMGPVWQWYDRSNNEQPIATHDVSGDGFDDVLVAHNRIEATRGGRTFMTAVVSLLDGQDGTTLWFREFGGVVPAITISGGTLVIAHETGTPTPGNPGSSGSHSELLGIRFTHANGKISDDQVWALTTGLEWAQWTGPVDMGGGMVAAAWTPPDAVDSTLMAIDASTGTTSWSSSIEEGVRLLRYDPNAEELVAAAREGEPPGTFHLFAVRSADGSVRMTTEPYPGRVRELQVGDATGDGLSDWVFAREHLDGFIGVRNRIGMVDGLTGLTLWERNVGPEAFPGALNDVENALPVHPADALQTDGIAIAEGRVFIASEHNNGSDHLRDLTALDALTGQEVWTDERDWPPGSHSLLLDRLDGEPTLFGVSYNGVLLAYDTTTQEVVVDSAIRSDIHHAVAAHVDGDERKDLIVGSFSGAVHALDAAHLRREGSPSIWRTQVSGPVHGLHLADVDGDESEEIVVVAEHEVSVLDRSTGAVRTRIPFENDYVWTLSLADVDGDGGTDIIVPTTTLSAYRGRDGALLWTWAPDLSPDVRAYFSTSAISDSAVVAQFAIERRLGGDAISRTGQSALRFAAGPPEPPGAAGVDLSTGELLWEERMASTLDRVALWRSVAAVPGWPGADGDAVALFRQEAGDATLSSIGVVRARTGEPLPSPPAYQASVFTGIEALPSGELMLYHWHSIARATPDAVHSYPINGQETYDAASVALGDGDTMIGVAAPNRLVLMPASALETQQPVTTALMPQLAGGTMLADDLDADGRHEIITFEYDYEAHNTVLRFQDGYIFSMDGLGRGLQVVETGPLLGAPNKGTAQTSLDTSHEKVGYRRAFTLSGTVTRDQGCTGPLEVSIQRKIRGENVVTTLASVPVDEMGSWKKKVKAARSARYSARVVDTETCEGFEERARRVSVRAALKDFHLPRTCGTGRIVSGRVAPNHVRTRVKLERRTRQRWSQISSRQLTRASRFRFPIKKCGLYRVRWPKQSVQNEEVERLFRVRRP